MSWNVHGMLPGGTRLESLGESAAGKTAVLRSARAPVANDREEPVRAVSSSQMFPGDGQGISPAKHPAQSVTTYAYAGGTEVMELISTMWEVPKRGAGDPVPHSLIPLKSEPW